MRRRALVAAAALLAAGCGRADPVTTGAEAPGPSVTTRADAPGPSIAPSPQGKRALPVDLVPAPPGGDVQDIVQRELARARGDGRRLLVYVGASWCEPCQRFHQAARSGQVDALFPGLRLLEFDLDRDRERLDKAGYASKMIPLFALPRLDGAASGEQIEGSIKGAGAVDQIAPRLQALLEK